MKNKRKWASILTIATSLILCIISTFGITLAFFGGNASANLSTITLKTGIEIGAAIESSVGSAKVVPGQPVKITATGTVSATTQGTNPDANNVVDGVVRAKFNVGNELGEVTIDGNNTDFWTDGNDGYYYLVTAENGTTRRTVSKGTSVQIFGDLTVSKNFTNADSGKSVEASVIFEVIQADIYKTDGSKEALTVTNATTSTSPLYSAFDAVKPDTKYLVTITIDEYYSGDLCISIDGGDQIELTQLPNAFPDEAWGEEYEVTIEVARTIEFVKVKHEYFLYFDYEYVVTPDTGASEASGTCGEGIIQVYQDVNISLDCSSDPRPH